jgi:hypothetical protein
VRDGRAAAVSLTEERNWGPRTPISGGRWWSTKVRAGRRAGRALGADRYCEIKFEDLTLEPEPILRALCRFLGEEYDAAMLEYPTGPATRELAHKPGRARLRDPPTPDARDWRAGLTTKQQRALNAICASQLVEFGYGPDDHTGTDLVRAWAVVARDLVLAAPVGVFDRARPGRRNY